MSVYAIGNIAGSFVCGPFADWWGRRWGMFSGAVVLLIGSILQGSAQNMAIFIGGRFLLGFGISLCQTSGTCYVAEMAHPAWRGPITGLYNSLWNMGAVSGYFSLVGVDSVGYLFANGLYIYRYRPVLLHTSPNISITTSNGGCLYISRQLVLEL